MKQVPESYEHQKEAFKFIEDKNIFALFMEQGTGKSKVVINKVYKLYMEGKIDGIVLVSPSAVMDQWVEEQFEIHYPDDNWNGFIWDGCKTQKSKKGFFKKVQDFTKLFVFSINVEAFQGESIHPYIRMARKERNIILIIDESTKIKNGRRKPARGKRGGAVRTNKLLDIAGFVEHKGILTGTPTPNSPFDLWSQFEFLKKDFFRMDYFYFRNHYGVMIEKRINQGRTIKTVLDEKTYNIVKHELNKIEKFTSKELERVSLKYGMSTGNIIKIKKMDKFASYKNLGELREKISDVTFFVKKKDCLDLPDKVYETLHCKLTPEQKRLYKELKKEMYTEYEGNELTVVNKLVLTLRLQMITGGLFPYMDEISFNEQGELSSMGKYKYELIKDNGKIKTLLDDIETIPQDTYVIIWARFTGEIDLIHKSLIDNYYTAEKYYGGSSKDIITSFKNKEFRFLIANPLKGAEGLNLQVATLQYHYSNSFRADTRLQSEDRSHRIGQTNKVTYKDLICKGTVDETIYAVLKRKENLINYFRSGKDKEGL